MPPASRARGRSAGWTVGTREVHSAGHLPGLHRVLPQGEGLGSMEPEPFRPGTRVASAIGKKEGPTMAHGPGRPRTAFVEIDPVPIREVTFLISDVECFTQLTERLGDHAALALMNRYYTMVRQTVAEHQGEEVELHGDGVVLAFACPVAA